jgi:hypothetical protein
MMYGLPTAPPPLPPPPPPPPPLLLLESGSCLHQFRRKSQNIATDKFTSMGLVHRSKLLTLSPCFTQLSYGFDCGELRSEHFFF